MLRVTVELVSARTGEVTHLGTALISNDGTGTATTGNYNVILSKWHRTKPFRGQKSDVWKRGHISGFPRLRLGVWDLMFRCLSACVRERNPLGPPDPPWQAFVSDAQARDTAGTLLEDEDL